MFPRGITIAIASIIHFDVFIISAFHHSSYSPHHQIAKNMASSSLNQSAEESPPQITPSTNNNIPSKIDINVIAHQQHEPSHKRRERKRLKKQAALERRNDRIAKNGGPPETTFLGKHKWLGGAVDPASGKIYGIPSHSHQIIVITPSSTNEEDGTIIEASISTIPLPNEYHEGQFKWLRGVIYNNCLYGIPAWSTKGVLKVELDTNTVSILPLPNESTHYVSNPIPWKERVSNVDRGRWMWHGGAIGINSNNGDAAIFCPPSNAEFVLKVYLDGSDRVEEIGMPLSDGQNKWYGKLVDAVA